MCSKCRLAALFQEIPQKHGFNYLGKLQPFQAEYFYSQISIADKKLINQVWPIPVLQKKLIRGLKLISDIELEIQGNFNAGEGGHN